MTKCNIVGCGARKTKNRPNLTFHRLPRNEEKKRKWLDIIGNEKLNPNTKQILICSLHFDESDFNRTMEVVRLRDDAIPSRLLMPSTFPETQAARTEKRIHINNKNAFSLVTIPSSPTVSETQCTRIERQSLIEPVSSTSSDFKVTIPSESTISETECSECVMEPVPGISNVFIVENPSGNAIEKLQKKCDMQTKKIKCLHQKLCRQQKRIASLRNIIDKLQENKCLNNDSIINLDDDEGSKDCLKGEYVNQKVYLVKDNIHRRQENLCSQSTFSLPRRITSRPKAITRVIHISGI